jgi:hypothetical protein
MKFSETNELWREILCNIVRNLNFLENHLELFGRHPSILVGVHGLVQPESVGHVILNKKNKYQMTQCTRIRT